MDILFKVLYTETSEYEFRTLSIIIFTCLILWLWKLWGNVAAYDIWGKKLPGPSDCYFSRNPLLDFREAKLRKEASKCIRDLLLGKLGDGYVCALKAIGQKTLITNHAEVIKTILSGHHEKFPKGARYNRLRFFLGNGLVTSSSPKLWQLHRRIINKGFAAEKFSFMEEVFLQKAQQWINVWKRMCQCNADSTVVVNLNVDFAKITTVVICKTAFSYDIDLEQSTTGGEKELPFGDVGFMLQEINQRLSDPTDWWFMLNPWRARRLNAEVAKSLTLVENIIAARLEQRKVQKTTRPMQPTLDDAPRDLLDLMLDSCDSAAAEGLGQAGSLMSPADLRDHVLTFLAAGHETTATTLTWLIYELCRHPDAQRCVHEEIDRVLQGKPVSIDQLSGSFPYIGAAIKETLRLHPPIPTIARQCAQDTEIEYTAGHNGPKKRFCLAKGTNIVCSIGLLHRNPMFWGTDAEVFNPDRFREDVIQATVRHPFQFIPFSAGPRNCIGQRFAHFELIAIAVSMLQNFHVSLTKENMARVTIEETLVQAPKNLYVTLKLRK
jgi:cytochrome P450